MHPEDAVTAHGHIYLENIRQKTKASEKEISGKNWKGANQEFIPAL